MQEKCKGNVEFNRKQKFQLSKQFLFQNAGFSDSNKALDRLVQFLTFEVARISISKIDKTPNIFNQHIF